MELVFRKPLSNTDVKHRLAIPMYALEIFQIAPEQHSKIIEAIDISRPGDHVWSFVLGCRRDDPNPRPEFRRGWRKFVRAKGLRAGDTIVFLVKRNPAGETKFMIGVETHRHVRIFRVNHFVYA